MFLHLREELFDLLLCEVVDGDGFEEVLGGDEAALAAFGDQLLLTSSRLSGSASRAGTLMLGPGGYLSRPRKCTEAGSW